MVQQYQAIYSGKEPNKIIDTPLGSKEVILGRYRAVTRTFSAENDIVAIKRAKDLASKVELFNQLIEVELTDLFRCERVKILQELGKRS